MHDNNPDTLRFEGPVEVDGCEVWKAIDDTPRDPRRWLFSCIAICRTGWKPGWPALGGTRWHQPERGQEPTWDAAVEEAVDLARAMYAKNAVLRHSAARVRQELKSEDGAGHSERVARLGNIFGWQGGKGVIWSPRVEAFSKKENQRIYLTPRRLMAHGRLIEHLAGEYVGSKDQGVATAQLRWIEKATRYTVGNDCKDDTGKATAEGVFAGLEVAARKLRLQDGSGPTQEGKPLAGVSVLVAGAGKVGLPLIRCLREKQAEVWVYEPEFESFRGTSDPAPYEEYLRAKEEEGATINLTHMKEDFREIVTAGRVFHDEEEALSSDRVQVISPNGGKAGWLTEPARSGGPERAALLARAADKGRLRLVLGAGNDQVSLTDTARKRREVALTALAGADVWFVPDPLVSPGGVIAVSHELLDQWDRHKVDEDARSIVKASVDHLFEEYGETGNGPDASRIWSTFERLVERPWT